ncbi:MAG: hypothetical protein F6K63_30910 [Moorea sp. SIO1G6]|uniref:Uncharacterized protein n=1 Tax=Moorena producens (strain JHB) TaxID=1454205 RepID=A0A1D9G4U8_MOOP1|nr:MULTISPECIES: hypothetical protein [Moorena]AOY82613.1 hypothetical protein BJP36_24540 [Moorena producens JHB]NET68569.1 hypothetical protein [Moorena sp. SIO1G6]
MLLEDTDFIDQGFEDKLLRRDALAGRNLFDLSLQFRGKVHRKALGRNTLSLSSLKKLESLEIQENQVLGKTHHHVMLNLPGHEKKYRNSFI